MTVPQSENDRAGKQRRYFVLVLAGVLLLVFLYMVSSIAAGVFGGILLWVMTRGIYEAILKRVRGRRSVAAGLSVCATVLLVVVPLAVVVMVITSDALKLASDLQMWLPTVQVKLDEWVSLLNRERLYVFGYELSPEMISTKLGEIATVAGQFLLRLGQQTVNSVVTGIIMLFIALYTLYFFYVDGDRFFEWLKTILPLRKDQSERLIESFLTSSIATLKTIGVLGVIQGVAAGTAYVIIGVPAPFLLTVLTIFATVIPSVGGAIVAMPVAAGLFIAGETGWAIALVAWYLVVVSNLDNFLRPYLMHREIRVHQLVIFVVTLGGIARYGLFGVFIGPVVAALLGASLDIYREIYPRSTSTDDIPTQPAS